MRARELKMLVLESSFLKEKLSMTEQIHAQTMLDFTKGFQNFTKTLPEEERKLVCSIQQAWDNKINVTSGNQAKQTNQDKQTNQEIQFRPKKQSKFSKDAFKNIAKKIHPDKLFDMDESERIEKIELIKKAQTAADKEDISELIRISDELGVEIPPPSKKQIISINKRNKNIKKKINSLEKTVSWSWYHAEGFEKQKIMLN